jgi:hypothetical protein
MNIEDDVSDNVPNFSKTIPPKKVRNGIKKLLKFICKNVAIN